MEALNAFIRPNRHFSVYLEKQLAEGRISSSLKRFGTGEFLFREGELIEHTFYILKGLVRLFAVNEEGCSKTVFFHKAKTLVGFQTLREEDHHSILNAITCTPCELMAISGSDYNKLLQKDAQASYHMTQYLFQMLTLQTREAVNASFYSVFQRLSALLLVLAEEQGMTEPPVTIPYSNQDFAEMLGVHRNSITIALNGLRKAGCIEKKRSGLVIVYFGKLKLIVRDMIPRRPAPVPI